MARSITAACSSSTNKERSSLALPPLDRQTLEFFIEAAAAGDRPPFIEEHLQRLPHGDPARDQQALGDDLVKRVRLRREHQLTERDAGKEEGQPDDQRRASLSQELTQARPFEPPAIGEVML